MPKDPNGKVLEGLEDFDGGETWMHVAPTKEELERFGVRLGKELDEEEVQGNKEGEKDGMVDYTREGASGVDEKKGIEQSFLDRG